MYMLCFYVPATHVDQVKKAVFATGAGKIGNYSHCSWQIMGEGQFLPLSGSHAFTGEEGLLETLPEYKVEMVCDDVYIQQAVDALKKSHPYEEPAYQVWRLENF